MVKRILSIMLALCISMAIPADVSASGSASEDMEQDVGNFGADRDEQKNQVNGQKDESAELPETMDSQGITDLILPYGITSISGFAYSGNSKITSVTIPGSVISIESYAFWSCSSLSSVIMPDSVKSIGPFAFSNCRNLKDIYYGGDEDDWNNISIGQFNESLRSATVHYNSTGPDDASFSGACGKNAAWKLENGVLTISGVGQMNDYALIGTSGNNHVNTPWNSVLDEIKSVIIQEGITCIGELAFTRCPNLTQIDIPDTVTSIHAGAFNQCYSLHSIELPDTLTDIGNYAFEQCTSLSSLEIPKTVTTIGWGQFEGCTNLTDIIIPDGITNIGWGTFNNCTKLRNVTIPKSVTYIDQYAFADCSPDDIYYDGNENDWSRIDIKENNGGLDYAVIHYTKTEDNVCHNVYCNGGCETFDISLEECLPEDSTQYNSKLAHMLIAMCNSVHSKTDMDATFDSFGFEKPNRERYDLVPITFSIGIKEVKDEPPLVLIIARGTTDIEEIIGDLRAKANTEHQHTGFAVAANALYKKMIEFFESKGFSEQDVPRMKFVIAGHSLGAATTNILTQKLIELKGGESKNIYAYTFACPDTAVITADTAKKYKSIFNIGNINDPITWLPGAIWTESGEKDGHGKNTYWNKYGNSRWYCNNEDWDNYNNILKKPLLAAGLIQNLAYQMNSYHPQNLYLDYLKLEKEWNTYKNFAETTKIINESAEKRREDYRKKTLIPDLRKSYPESGNREKIVPEISVLCPVDIEIYDSEGILAGRVTNNKATDVAEDKIYVGVFEDNKYIYLLDYDEYSIRLTGTANGTMTYAVKNINIDTADSNNEQIFENVFLTDGKKMTSTVKSEDIGYISDVKLFVLDREEKIEKEVLSDGKGTEIPANSEIGPPEQAGDTDSIIKVNNIKIAGISHKIAAGKKIALKTTISPTKATNKTVTWSSSNKKLASVNSKGVVTMKKASKGKSVTITAAARDGSKKTASYKIKGMKGVVKKITVSGRKTRSVKAEKSINLKATVKASKGANKILKWKSSNKKYATVNSKGKVITKKAGKGKTVKITAIAVDGSGKKATIKININ